MKLFKATVLIVVLSSGACPVAFAQTGNAGAGQGGSAAALGSDRMHHTRMMMHHRTKMMHHQKKMEHHRAISHSNGHT